MQFEWLQGWARASRSTLVVRRSGRPGDATSRTGHRTFPVALALALSAAAVALPSFAESQCTKLGFNNFPQAKKNKLYVYFPASEDNQVPEVGQGSLTTKPVHAFDVTDLKAYLGTDPELREAIVDVVTDDYCEFNVEVIGTTTFPPTTFARRNTVAIGTDSMFHPGSAEQWGQGQGPDAQDQTAVDFARVWAGTYQDGAGQPGGELEGPNSTVTRWATAIGGTVAHEAGHNYGITHDDGYAQGTFEDGVINHLMADGSVFLYPQRAGYRRHFSDNEYSILATNVGLSVQSMWNWTFVNPNQEVASGFSMHFVSLQSSLTLATPYVGSLSPWLAPTLVHKGLTNFRNNPNYHEYEISWNTGHAWAGGAPGQVPGGVSFTVGTGFNTIDPNAPDAIIIVSTALSGADRGKLALHPRIPGFDSGTFNPSDGMFEVAAINARAEPLIVEDATVQFFPRLVSIDSMVSDSKRRVDSFDMPISPWGEKRPDVRVKAISSKLDVRLRIAQLREGRRVVSIIDAQKCGRNDRADKRPDTSGCKPGINLSLFPSTSMLLTINVLDPMVKQWDRERQTYVMAPLRTTIRYQLVGRRPDLNRNGIDDYIDIVTGRAKDRHGDWLIFPLPPRR